MASRPLPYLGFVREHARFLGFGFLVAFFSSFGQTFFISQFGGAIRHAFGLTHGTYGALYSSATLASGFAILWVGRFIDTLSLTRWTTFVCVGLATACGLLAAAPTAWFLIPAFFCLRQTGQGLMSHTAITAMARAFRKNRGRAISVASLGFAGGEACLPFLAVTLLEPLGWRIAWAVFAGLVLLVMLPATPFLLRERNGTSNDVRELHSDQERSEDEARSWTQRQVLRDPRFYMVLPAALMPAFLVTGFFFHQVHLIETKGWEHEWFAASFAVFALFQVPSSLLSGGLVDRFTALRLLPAYLAPICLALACLATWDAPACAPLFLALTGMTLGATGPILGALWPELYGSRHLGAIRSLGSSCMVISTAISPVWFGWMLDRGTSFASIAWGSIVIAAIASGLAWTVSRRAQRTHGVRTG